MAGPADVPRTPENPWGYIPWEPDPRYKRRSWAHIQRGRRQHRDCTAGRAAWVRAEIRAHIELKTHGHTAKYKRLERASETAYNKAWKRGCAWTRRAR